MPDQQTVDQTARGWVLDQLPAHPELLRAAYFGSYARRDWGVGSDLDLLLIVAHSDRPFTQRAESWDALDLPVPVDLLIYTAAEWQAMTGRNDRFPRQVDSEAVWIFPQTQVKPG